MRRLLSIGVVLFGLLGSGLAQDSTADTDQGTLRGFVLDLGTGSTLHGVKIEVQPNGQVVSTDLDGLFSVDLPAGDYALSVSKPGYINWKIEGVSVPAGGEVWQEVPLTPEAGVSQETVEVVASTERASEQALLSERKGLALMTDSVGRQEMSLNPGSDGADVMQRVTGVSVVDNKYVFVRGLGERYSATQLNGSQIPSTQPDKKVVAMDLFPASLLENIQTEKSYSPDQPGEFAGGLVKVNTLDFPREAAFKVSYGTSFNSITTFEPFMDYPGGDYEFWGFDDGTRHLPSPIPSEKLVRKTLFTDGFTAEELQTFGRSFSNVWEFDSSNDAIPGQKFSIMGGNTWGKLGLVFAVTHGTDYESRTERRTFYKANADRLLPSNDYDFAISEQTARTSGTANLAYRLSSDHKLLFRNFYTHDSTDEARMFEGSNRDFGNDIRNFRLRLQEEQILSSQVGGEHYLGLLGGNTLLEWSLSRSRSTLEDPDLRETLYEFDDARGQFVLADESQSGFRQFLNLAEEIWDPKVNLTTFFHGGGLAASVKVGASYRDRSRDFQARRFRFIPVSTRGIDLSASPETILRDENIRPNGFELREETRNTDGYGAHQINRSFYAMADLSFGKWRFVGGGRLESDVQRIDTFDPFAPDLVQVSTELDNTDFLPALNVTYQLAPQMNLRGSVSRTLNRPEFRELAPFDFTDVIGGRSIQGFAGLQRATIQNYDLRWEWFPTSTGLVSGSFFFKRFDDPIERVIEATAQLRTSFRNAESADNFGFELDFRRDLGFLSRSLEDFRINLNYTFVDSSVEVPTGGLLVLTTLERPLAGQSQNVFNTILEYQSPDWGSTFRALYNFQGERISDVGALGLPDIIEDGYNSLDAVFIQPFGAGDKWNLKVSGKNLLDEEIRYLQGGLPQRVYNVGRTLSLSISYSFFDR